jgi:hypothetical protein
MTTYDVPEDYKLYVYSAIGMMFLGIVAFIISLIFGDVPLVSASIAAISCGFLLSSGMFIGIVRNTKKKKDINLSIIAKILIIAAIGYSTYLIIYSGFSASNPEFNITTMYITQGIIIPIVVVSIIAYDMYLVRKKKNEQEISED